MAASAYYSETYESSNQGTVILQLLAVPCVPLARGAAMAGCSHCSVVTIGIFTALLFVGNLVTVSLYWILRRTMILDSIFGVMIPLFGWTLYMMGPAISFLLWSSRGSITTRGATLASRPTKDCVDGGQDPGWMALALVQQLVLVIIALNVRGAIQQHFKIQSSNTCCAGCIVCCMPFCAIAITMEEAREMRMQQRQETDELPANSV